MRDLNKHTTSCPASSQWLGNDLNPMLLLQLTLVDYSGNPCPCHVPSCWLTGSKKPPQQTCCLPLFCFVTETRSPCVIQTGFRRTIFLPPSVSAGVAAVCHHQDLSPQSLCFLGVAHALAPLRFPQGVAWPHLSFNSAALTVHSGTEPLEMEITPPLAASPLPAGWGEPVSRRAAGPVTGLESCLFSLAGSLGRIILFRGNIPAVSFCSFSKQS